MRRIQLPRGFPSRNVLQKERPPPRPTETWRHARTEPPYFFRVWRAIGGDGAERAATRWDRRESRKFLQQQHCCERLAPCECLVPTGLGGPLSRCRSAHEPGQMA